MRTTSQLIVIGGTRDFAPCMSWDAGALAGRHQRALGRAARLIRGRQPVSASIRSPPVLIVDLSRTRLEPSLQSGQVTGPR